jgi:hypothetical protein
LEAPEEGTAAGILAAGTLEDSVFLGGTGGVACPEAKVKAAQRKQNNSKRRKREGLEVFSAMTLLLVAVGDYSEIYFQY